MKRPLLLLLLPILLVACQSSSSENQEPNPPLADNPAAEGFNLEGSDPQAIAWADSVMAAMGGRKAWDETNAISWNFMGNRQLYWDRKHQRVRVDIPGDSTILIRDLNRPSGKAFVDGEEITNPDTLARYLQAAMEIWINDSYWLVMPFKLKDTGVTLSYLGKGTDAKGDSARILELTFEEVGVTPHNKYRVWIGEESHLVEQWAYYRESEDEAPVFISPWHHYQTHGGILLSADRSSPNREGKMVERKMMDIEVSESLPDSLFRGI